MSSKPVILVVDDDMPILMLMRNLLREFGFEAVTVNNGPEAIEGARARTPDLILLDKNMPGMPGDEVIRNLRNESSLASVPILILSGEPVGPDEITRLGANGAVLKPFDVPELIDQIRSYVGAART
ncbi:MAG TPA: response regulator [Thermoanaerobaculia bacterium]